MTNLPVVRGESHSEPTYENQLWHARKLAQEQGVNALDNPHGMIGRTCHCGSCFCCAAAQVVAELKRDEQIEAHVKSIIDGPQGGNGPYA